MRKDQIYSWRVSTEMKASLERAAVRDARQPDLTASGDLRMP